MTERRTMEEAMEAIERVEKSQQRSVYDPIDPSDLRLLISIAKRAVREPSESEIERMQEVIDSTDDAATIIKAWQCR